jgi:hypothetical protein
VCSTCSIQRSRILNLSETPAHSSLRILYRSPALRLLPYYRHKLKPLCPQCAKFHVSWRELDQTCSRMGTSRIRFLARSSWTNVRSSSSQEIPRNHLSSNRRDTLMTYRHYRYYRHSLSKIHVQARSRCQL